MLFKWFLVSKKIVGDIGITAQLFPIEMFDAAIFWQFDLVVALDAMFTPFRNSKDFIIELYPFS